MRARPHYSMTPLEIARHFGAGKALQRTLLKSLRLRPVVLISRDPRLHGWAPAKDYSIRRASPGDSALFAAAGFEGMLQQKLAEGPGWVCVADGRLAGWNFLGTQQSVIAGWLILRSARRTAIWGTGTWVHRDFRGHGLARELRGRAGEWCAAEGYSELLGWIDLTNYSSRRASLKLGAREIARITMLQLLGRALVHDGRRWHLGRWSAARPLVLSVDSIRRDRRDGADGRAAAPCPSAARRG